MLVDERNLHVDSRRQRSVCGWVPEERNNREDRMHLSRIVSQIKRPEVFGK